ncbi:MATE efflux family protein [Aureobasidium pullulans]|uniref:MATE efflux family protein n=1 Tax=Aureobasidium pullulans TaxID=5580 RepID=A0A4S9YCH6_AURPU|nr:MATE efflux family protein [Aureobasidium pullulans]
MSRPATLSTSLRSANGFLSSSPLAQESILRDLVDAEGEEEEECHRTNNTADGDQDFGLSHEQHYSMAGSYRRTSYVASGPRPLFPSAQAPESRRANGQDREAALAEERSLLRDNHLIHPKHPRTTSTLSKKPSGLLKKSFVTGFVPRKGGADEESAVEDGRPNENTSLLGNPAEPYGGIDTPENIDKRWEEAVASGKIKTTWQREAIVLARYSRSLILTFLLQYSLTVTSVFTVGHIGKLELGAVSLASMTATITGYSVYQGLATSLDTLCAQAYGSGNKTLVGLQLQRMVYFLWVITIPIAIIWAAGPSIIGAIVPEKATAELAGQYLRVLIIGAPGYAAFEAGKRFVQAQGMFSATLIVLLICAPLNVFLHWLFVWRLGFGFIGAPIAVVIIENLMPLSLFLYVRFFGGMECWGGFSKLALRNWMPMIRLALPGLVMILAEYLAFEILTLSASWISPTHLATQSVLSTISTITYQIPFPISIAASTRIANLIGATLSDAAKVNAKVSLYAALFVGIFNMILLSSTREYIPRLFTNDADVIELTAKTLPLNAAFQLFDSLAALCNGILRGLGRQEIGGYVNLFAYYVIAMPISFGTGFGLHWDLYGLWAGPALALGIVAAVEGWFIYQTSWEKAVEEAQERNALS